MADHMCTQELLNRKTNQVYELTAELIAAVSTRRISLAHCALCLAMPAAPVSFTWNAILESVGDSRRPENGTDS